MVQYKRMDHQQYLLIFYIKKGTAITTALISLFTDQKVPTNLAMTGEISLNGEVCKIGKIFKIYSIGGLQAKIIGAKTLKIDTIIVP